MLSVLITCLKVLLIIMLLKKVGNKERKDDLLVSIYYPKFHNLKNAISNYYRIRCFILGVTKYLRP
jgi:hypothetical protein